MKNNIKITRKSGKVRASVTNHTDHEMRASISVYGATKAVLLYTAATLAVGHALTLTFPVALITPAGIYLLRVVWLGISSGKDIRYEVDEKGNVSKKS